MLKASCSLRKGVEKIMLISATRAEWYLLRNLCHEIQNDKDLSLQIIATGAHLSPEFGLTYKEIEKEFKITKKIPILLANDDKISLCKSMSLAFSAFSDAFEDLNPDTVVILGDRYEMLSMASVCLLMHIPLVHLCGGELTLGAIDDSIRHSTSKMAHLHFVSHEIYKKRVLQLGEEEKRVFNIGSLASTIIKNMNFLSKKDLEKALEMKLDKELYLITYHPLTLNVKNTQKEIKTLLKKLDALKNASLIFTKENADENGLLINEILQNYCQKNSHKAKLFDNLGSQKYLSLMKIAKAMIGNSSSDISESPFFKTPCINIGDRQKGRLRTQNIIDCEINDLDQAFEKLESKEFKQNLKNFKNPYDNDKNPNKIIKTCLKNVNLDTILHKNFIDL
ncbi:TPA: GDP-N,N'-diacetylbacillosamine 2-epimerase (hydrolyzing) [Campylobacter jejuni]|uniref:UDP-N-acetylglucosamine 2-epimerase n=1 Tax=Campylobacter jejuni TaxID=197 RepID=UPI00142533A6|nr:UDP-N-acetylglucosamine 2-epimerase [Campylobacter jejuni]ECO3382325.1 GDP-N,N'-diacetylbacillosamine 2-epimerase (hydrolyzing) [Campylobacter jejuni]ECQ1227617.1 GDP-N,N'-diacetylbacillosamine 2-epimerase (hydrolyzing) [Campylobacter jejuni]ECQ9303470.1 GDP-N,N'-diacetylbacillosamine 2-epimerase (hydrolyzing) [Campylobacter jejuni]EGA8617634.1 GDP-N,N'-diacetylbacillosamine 2-epimerase (hydrolyzing) [Campylobacter jejuni]MBO7019089.1 GDP-N,N'-diacetylbacillosamine 2-epimerase (hydrolyzing)